MNPPPAKDKDIRRKGHWLLGSTLDFARDTRIRSTWGKASVVAPNTAREMMSWVSRPISAWIWTSCPARQPWKNLSALCALPLPVRFRVVGHGHSHG